MADDEEFFEIQTPNENKMDVPFSLTLKAYDLRISIPITEKIAFLALPKFIQACQHKLLEYVPKDLQPVELFDNENKPIIDSSDLPGSITPKQRAYLTKYPWKEIKTCLENNILDISDLSCNQATKIISANIEESKKRRKKKQNL